MFGNEQCAKFRSRSYAHVGNMCMAQTWVFVVSLLREKNKNREVGPS